MPIEFAVKDENIALIRVTGMFEKAEFDEAQCGIASLIRIRNKIKILIITQDFEGWEKSEKWQDISSIGPNDPFIEKNSDCWRSEMERSDLAVFIKRHEIRTDRVFQR